jgi:hypothetical protein
MLKILYRREKLSLLLPAVPLYLARGLIFGRLIDVLHISLGLWILFCLGSSWAKIKSGRIFNKILVELWMASKQASKHTNKKKRGVIRPAAKKSIRIAYACSLLFAALTLVN